MKRKLLAILLMLLICPVSIFLSGCFSTKYSIEVDKSLKNITVNANKNVAEEGEEVTLSYSNLNPNYVFEHYTVNNNKIVGNKFIMPDKDVKISASIRKVYYSINFVLGENETTTNVNRYKETDGEIVLTDAVKVGYIFMGWYLDKAFNGDPVTKIICSEKQEYVLYPKFVCTEVSEDGFRYIASAFDFIEIIPTNPTAKYRLLNDIDFDGFNCVSICSNELDFAGEFDGNNKTIKNVNLNNTSDLMYAGLFGSLNEAKIYDLKLENFQVVSLDYSADVGALAGRVLNSEIKNIVCNNIKIDISSTDYSSSVGSLVGQATETDFENIKVESSEIKLQAKIAHVGFVVGYTSSCNLNKCCVINRSINNITITGFNVYVGGVIGLGASSTVSNCYFKQFNDSNIIINQLSTTQNANAFFGGIAGAVQSFSEILNCYSALYSVKMNKNVQNQTIKNNFGGIVASASYTDIVNCFVSANKVGGNNNIYLTETTSVGYVVCGLYNSDTTNCYVDSDVKFMKGISINNEFKDGHYINKEKYSLFKAKLGWDTSVWDFSIDNNLPTLK